MPKIIKGLKLRRQINKLLRILYFEFKDIMRRGKELFGNKKEGSVKYMDNVIAVSSDIFVYWDYQTNSTLFLDEEDDKDSTHMFCGIIETATGGYYDFYAHFPVGAHLPHQLVNDIAAKLDEINREFGSE